MILGGGRSLSSKTDSFLDWGIGFFGRASKETLEEVEDSLEEDERTDRCGEDDLRNGTNRTGVEVGLGLIGKAMKQTHNHQSYWDSHSDSVT